MGTYREPTPGIVDYSGTAKLMGQQLFDPPTVEGWHTGHEWIDGGTLNERVNFAVNEVGDLSKPGISELVERMGADGDTCPPAELVERSLELAGPVEVSDDTRAGLLRYAEAVGDLRFDTEDAREDSATHIGRMLQLIVSTREYQMA